MACSLLPSTYCRQAAHSTILFQGDFEILISFILWWDEYRGGMGRGGDREGPHINSGPGPQSRGLHNRDPALPVAATPLPVHTHLLTSVWRVLDLALPALSWEVTWISLNRSRWEYLIYGNGNSYKTPLSPGRTGYFLTIYSRLRPPPVCVSKAVCLRLT